MSRPKQSISERMYAHGVAIENTLANPEILSAVTLFGYDQARVQGLQTLHLEVDGLNKQQEAAYGDQHQATQDLYHTWDGSKGVYMPTLKVARVAFRGNPAAQKALALGGKRQESLPKWLAQVLTFYDNLLGNPTFLATMGSFGFDETRLQADRDLAEAVRQADLLQETAKGKAQALTQQRDEKLAELDTKMADYKAIAQVALADNPQWLEILGYGAGA